MGRQGYGDLRIRLWWWDSDGSCCCLAKRWWQRDLWEGNVRSRKRLSRCSSYACLLLYSRLAYSHNMIMFTYCIFSSFYFIFLTRCIAFPVPIAESGGNVCCMAIYPVTIRYTHIGWWRRVLSSVLDQFIVMWRNIVAIRRSRGPSMSYWWMCHYFFFYPFLPPWGLLPVWSADLRPSKVEIFPYSFMI